MPRGKQESNKTYFKVAYENNNKDKGQPFFAEQKKVGDEWKGISEDTFLEGKIVGISNSSYEYKGEKQHVFELIINGGEENYALQLNYGYFTRSILNSIAPITDLANTELRLEIYRNKEGYTTVAVKANGDRTDWLIPNKQLPASGEEKWNASFEHFIGIIKENIPKEKEPVGLKDKVDMDLPVEKLAEAIDAEKPEDINKSDTEDNIDPDSLPF